MENNLNDIFELVDFIQSGQVVISAFTILIAYSLHSNKKEQGMICLQLSKNSKL
jgi:hypothetical protein